MVNTKPYRVDASPETTVPRDRDSFEIKGKNSVGFDGVGRTIGEDGGRLTTDGRP